MAGITSASTACRSRRVPLAATLSQNSPAVVLAAALSQQPVPNRSHDVDLPFRPQRSSVAPIRAMSPGPSRRIPNRRPTFPISMRNARPSQIYRGQPAQLHTHLLRSAVHISSGHLVTILQFFATAKDICDTTGRWLVRRQPKHKCSPRPAYVLLSVRYAGPTLSQPKTIELTSLLGTSRM